MGTQIGNGHTGTEHMTAARWQAVFKSLWGADNVVFKTGSELAITITPGTGTVTVADGVFSFNGVLGVVETSDTATYVKPASDTIYAKIGVAVKYTKDSGTQVEALDIVCLKSAETASVALAQAETIDYGDGKIETAITEAYYPLCEFIANASEYSELESFVNKVDTLPALSARLATAEHELNLVKNKSDTAYEYVEGVKPVFVTVGTISTSGDYITVSTDDFADYSYVIIETSAGRIKELKELLLSASDSYDSKFYLQGRGTGFWVNIRRVSSISHNYKISYGNSSGQGSVTAVVYKSKY